MFEHEKRKFLANSKIKSFYILLYNGWHMISLKYDNFRFFWAVVTEKKTFKNSVYAKISDLPAGILND